MLLYTGGTTGMPKGVMWRQDDLFGALDAANRKRLPPEPDLAAANERVVKPGPRNLPAAPLMHGTGFFNALSNLMIGGSVITMAGRRFDAVELLDTVEHERINSMSIVGDAFAKPILRALDPEPDRWDISSLRVIVSSGVIWSAQTKAGLLRHNERLNDLVALVDRDPAREERVHVHAERLERLAGLRRDAHVDRLGAGLGGGGRGARAISPMLRPRLCNVLSRGAPLSCPPFVAGR